MHEQKLSFVHRFVPGVGGAASTTLLLLHGTGGDENDLLELGGKLLPGATLLSPRGKVLENGMPRFFRRLAEGVFDLDDLRRRTHELADFIEEASSAYSLDRHGIIAVGYSNGANIAASTLFLRPDAISSAALFRPMVPFVPAPVPNLSGKSIFVAGGRQDPIAHESQTLRLVELFSSAGAVVEVHRHEGGHELGNDDVLAARNWITRRSALDSKE